MFQITNLVVAVDPPVFYGAPVLVVFEISFASVGNSHKTIEVILNGVANRFIPAGTDTLVSDLILQSGSTLTVTVNTYTSSGRSKGKLCSTETREIIIPLYHLQ